MLNSYPEAKFIHIVRDGRAVANSWLQMPWWNGYKGPQNWLWGDLNEAYQEEWLKSNCSYVTLAAISWKILMQSYHESENDLSKENYLSLRYEDVVSDPTHYFKQIIAFSGLNLEPSFTQALDDYHFTSHRFKSYEQDLNRAQLDELNNSLGEVLQQYHYD